MTSDAEQDTATVEVERNDRGWMVVEVADGERTLIEPPHPDQDAAEVAATSHRVANDMWGGVAAATPDERPENRKIVDPESESR